MDRFYRNQLWTSIHYNFSCLSVCACVTDVGVAVTNLWVVCKTITCASAFTEMAILIFPEIIVKAAGLDTLCCRLRERCHCGRLPSHYRRARTQDYLAQRAESKAATVATSD